MSGFDPDAYLASKAVAFDPDAYLKAKAAPRAPPDVSGGLAFGRGAAQGAQLGFGDEIEGAVQAVGQKLFGPFNPQYSTKPIGQLYRESRDASRREYKDAEKAHPGLYMAGQLVGGLAPATVAAGAGAAAPAYGAAEKLAKAARALKVGTGLGAAGALGASDSQDVGQLAADTAKGGALGMGLTVAAPLVGAGVSAVARPVARLLREKAIEQGRRVLMGGAQSLSRKLPVSADAVQEALDSGGIRAFSSTKGTAQRLDRVTDTVGDQYSSIVDALEAKGIKGPDAQALAQSIEAEGRSVGENTLNRAVPKIYADTAQDLAAGTTYPGASPTNPGPLRLTRAENLKRSLQRKAKYDMAQPGADFDVNEARKDVASMLRRGVEDSIDRQAPAAGPEAEAIAAQFVPVKQQYGRLAEALRAAEAGVNQAGRRSGPSLTDTVAGAAMAAQHGVVRGLATKYSHQLWRERGPSTMSAVADSLANGVEATPGGGNMSLGDFYRGLGLFTRKQALIDALRRPLLGSAAEAGGEHIPQGD